jgi:hypothetical protein
MCDGMVINSDSNLIIVKEIFATTHLYTHKQPFPFLFIAVVVGREEEKKESFCLYSLFYIFMLIMSVVKRKKRMKEEGKRRKLHIFKHFCAVLFFI